MATDTAERLRIFVDPIEDPYYRAIWGGRYIRQLAYMKWCGLCQTGTVLTGRASLYHEAQHTLPDGRCRSIERINDEPCRCPWRPTDG